MLKPAIKIKKQADIDINFMSVGMREHQIALLNSKKERLKA